MLFLFFLREKIRIYFILHVIKIKHKHNKVAASEKSLENNQMIY